MSIFKSAEERSRYRRAQLHELREELAHTEKEIAVLRTEMQLQDEIAQARDEALASGDVHVDASKRLHDLCKHGYGPGTRGHTISEPLALLAMDQYLAHGADPNYVDTESDDFMAPAGATPLIWAVRMNSEAWVRRLLAANADPTIHDRSPFAAMWGPTALDNAEMWSQMQGEVTDAKLRENERIIRLLTEGAVDLAATAA